MTTPAVKALDALPCPRCKIIGPEYHAKCPHIHCPPKMESRRLNEVRDRLLREAGQ